MLRPAGLCVVLLFLRAAPLCRVPIPSERQSTPAAGPVARCHDMADFLRRGEAGWPVHSANGVSARHTRDIIATQPVPDARHRGQRGAVACTALMTEDVGASHR